MRWLNKTLITNFDGNSRRVLRAGTDPEEIAQRFGISRIKVGRLLKKARHEGIVEINVKYHPVFSSQIEQQFIQNFGIKRALIALDHHDEDEQRQQVAALVSNYLATILKTT